MAAPVKISVIVPIYGVEKYIAKFADSLLGQPYPHVQFIFVNDGTKDSSIEILESLIEEKYSALKDRIVIVNKENGGLPTARKAGMNYADGDYIYHVDSDDWLEENSLGQIAQAAEQTDADIIYFDFVKVYADKSKVKIERDYSADQRLEYVRKMYNHRAYGCVWNKCIKRSLYEAIPTYFPQYSYGDDIYVTSQLVARAKSIFHLPKCLYYYRKDNPTSITRQKSRKRYYEIAVNFLDLYERYKDVPADMNPLTAIGPDLLMRAGMYSVMYGFRFFDLYPDLAERIAETPVLSGSRVPVPVQMFLKIYSRFKKKK